MFKMMRNIRVLLVIFKITHFLDKVTKMNCHKIYYFLWIQLKVKLPNSIYAIFSKFKYKEKNNFVLTKKIG